MASQGSERITREIPHIEVHLLCNFDKNGIVMLGSWVAIDNILVSWVPLNWKKKNSLEPPIGYKSKMTNVYI